MSGDPALREAALARSQTWWLLARLVSERPVPGFVAELRRLFPYCDVAPEPTVGGATGAQSRATLEPVRSTDRSNPPTPAPPAASPALALAAALADPDPTLSERLCVEHTRLFRGIQKDYGPPPPYESLYRGADLMGAPALAVRAAYAEAGLGGVVPADGLPDGLGTELRFLALLAFNEAEAWSAGPADFALTLLDRQRAFLDRHLLTWLPAFADQIEAVGKEPLYRAVMRLALGFAGTTRVELDEVQAWLHAA